MNSNTLRRNMIRDLEKMALKLKAMQERASTARDLATLVRRTMDVQRELAKLIAQDEAEKKQRAEARGAVKAATALDKLATRRAG